MGNVAYPKGRASLLASLVLIPLGLSLGSAPAQAGCNGCGFNSGLYVGGIGGLALGALAGAAARPSEPAYIESQGMRDRPVRMRQPAPQAYDPDEDQPQQPAHRKAASRHAPKKELAEKTRSASSKPVAPAPAPAATERPAAQDRSFTTASTGALLP
jgi:hypothetical protein